MELDKRKRISGHLVTTDHEARKTVAVLNSQPRASDKPIALEGEVTSPLPTLLQDSLGGRQGW